MNKILTRFCPGFILFVSIFNNFISHFLIEYLYLYLIVAWILTICTFKLDAVRLDTRIFFAVFFYFFIILLVTVVQSIFLDHSMISYKALILYSYSLVFWLVYMTIADDDDLKFLFSIFFLSVLVVSFGAIIQVLYSPTLFGLTGFSESNLFKWSEGLQREEYITFFRATSFLSSPQVLASFLGISLLVLASRFVWDFKNPIYVIIVIVVTIAGLLSGSKMFALSLFISAFILFKNRKYFIYLLAFLPFFILAIQLLSDIKMFDRVFDISNIIEQENTDSRLSRYLNVMLLSNPIIGNGIGSHSILRNELNTDAVESYAFQLWFEGGLIVFVSFLSVLWVSVKSAFKYHRILVPIYLFIYINMISVHSINSPEILIFWFFIVYPFYKNNNYFSTVNVKQK